MVKWLTENIPWIFSGIGVFVLGFLIYRNTNKKNIKQTQKGGKNSKNIQVGGDFNIKSRKKDE